MPDRTVPFAAEGNSRTAVLLDWPIAALGVETIVLGQVMTQVPRQAPLRGDLFRLHMSLGLLVLALVVVRLAWRLPHRPPALPVDRPPWHRHLANLTHIAFNVLLLAQPLPGSVASSFGKYGVNFFGLAWPASGSDTPAVREPFPAAHHLIADLLVALNALHLAGMAWHRLGREPLLWRRMWR